jgi:MoaA/NifB/PqqE/SkfB family radical SAM enzyme
MDSQLSAQSEPELEGIPAGSKDREAIAAWVGGLNGVRVAGCLELPRPFAHHDELAWAANLPEWEAFSDGPRIRSQLVLFEDGRPLAMPHASHADIGALGEGRYSHWGAQLYFSSSDGSSPKSNGRRYVAVRLASELVRGSSDEVDLPPLFAMDPGGLWTAALPGTEAWSDIHQIRPSTLQVLEDGKPLGPGNCISHHWAAERGGGAYVHWGDELLFSTTDGSDPNTNGRRYSVRACPPASADPDARARVEYLERYYSKRELQFNSPLEVWDRSPHAEYFRSRGGNEIAPPTYANVVGLTSFCNLKCTICGSQEAIDHEGIPRLKMKPEVMESVADTIFPFLSVVILASLGEPTIYPWFNQVLEKCHEHGASIKLESNATALTPRMIKLLTSVKGELFFSIDATGELFEKVRVGAKWAKVRSNLEHLMEARDPELTKMNMYPTISRRTLPDMMNILMVADELGFDELTFHPYDPTMFAKEERPTPEEFQVEKDKITSWCNDQARTRDMSTMSIKVSGDEVNPFVDPPVPLRSLPQNHPVHPSLYEQNGWKCRAPLQNLDIGPDGQIYPCVWSGARPQDNTMGYATSKEAFADAWFGERYRDLRDAHRWDSDKPINVAQCDVCLKRYG